MVSFLNSRDVHLTEEDYFSIWKNNLKSWSSHLHENKEVDFYRWYEGILSRVGITYDKSLIDLFNNFWMEGFKNFTKPIQGAGKLLSKLKRQGYKLGVVSNGFARNTVLDLQRTGLDSYFSSLVISSDVGYRKPDPLLFYKALEELEAAPLQAVMVGDNMEEDICGAKKVGLKTAWVRGNDGLRSVAEKVLGPDRSVQFNEADVVVEKLEDLYLLLTDGRWPG